MLSACSREKTKAERHPDSISSFELFRSDTINRTDVSGRKQGKWYLFENNDRTKVPDTVFYKDGKVVQKNY